MPARPQQDPLRAAFDEIHRMADEYQHPLRPNEADYRVGTEEVRALTNLRSPSSDLQRAKDLQDLGGKANPDQGALDGNFGRSTPVDATTGVVPTVWGGGAHLNAGTATDFGAPVALAQLRCDDEKGGILAVTLLPPSGEAFGADAYVPTAVLEFGTGGNVAKAHVDYVAGQIVQVPGSWFRVSGRLDPAYGTTPINTSVTALLGANIAHLPKGRVSPLSKTYWLATPLGAGATARVQIPPFATACRFVYGRDFPGAIAPNLVQLIAADAQGSAIYSQDLGTSDVLQLSGLAAMVEVFNNGAANINKGAALIFTIEL